MAGDLLVFSVTAPVTASYTTYDIPLPGAGKYLIELSGASTSFLVGEGTFDVEWDTYLGAGCTGYCYVDGNESFSSETFSGFGPKYSYLFTVPSPLHYESPVGPGNPYGVPPETLIIYDEIYPNPRINLYFEDLADTLDLTASYTITVKSIGAVPEPGTWTLMITGFAAAGTMLRRRRSLFAN